MIKNLKCLSVLCAIGLYQSHVDKFEMCKYHGIPTFILVKLCVNYDLVEK